MSDVTISDRPSKPVGRVVSSTSKPRLYAQPDPDPTRPSAIKRRQAKSNIQLPQPVDNMNATVVHIADDEMPTATTATARVSDARDTDIKNRGVLN